MRKFILDLLDKIPLQTEHRISLGVFLKIWYYNKYHKRCLCGGEIRTYAHINQNVGWETVCMHCRQLYNEG